MKTFRDSRGRFKRPTDPIEKELWAMKIVYQRIKKLKPESKRKVLNAVSYLFGIK